uniref:ANK_REP_REGION domain-containing protein n=1 Tax=Mesocestoides corti TaxID=53468 RepID=A0A5K3F8D3_MESCO
MLACSTLNNSSRKQQIESWESSDTNKEVVMPRPAERVKFPIDVQFHAACSNSELDEVKDLLSKGVDINVANADGLTVLHQACIDNNYEVAQFLLSNGANVNVQDNEGWTPLHACASCSYTELAKLLLDKGADASIVSFELELPLDVAQGADMVSLLKDWMQNHSIDEKAARSAEEQLMLRDAREWLASGDYPNVVDPRTGATALHIAAAKGYSEVLELLLKLPDVEVDATDVDGWTPLHAAAHWAKEKPLRLLAAAGASFDAITLTNQSIYDVADRSITMLLRQLREAHRNDQQRAADEKSSTVATRGKPDEEERPEMTKEEAGGGGEGEDENATPAAPKLAKMEEKAEEAVEEATRKELPRAAKEKPEGGRPHTPPKPSSPPPAIKAEDEREDEEEEEDEVEETAVKPESEEPTVSTDLPEKAKEVEKEETVKPMEASKKPERESPPPRQTPTKPAELSPARSPPPPSPPPASVTSPSPTSSIAAAPGKPEQVSDHSSAPPSPPLAANPENTATAVDTSTTPASAPSRSPRHHRKDSTKIKRISAVLAPARSEETEAQRSSKARLVRSTRRSTQGISTDVLEEARRLSAGVGAATSASTPNAPSPTPAPVQTPEKASRGAIPPPPTSPKLSITVQTSVRPLSKAVREAAGGSDVDDAEAKPATHVSKATILPTQPSSSSSTDTTNSSRSFETHFLVASTWRHAHTPPTFSLSQQLTRLPPSSRTRVHVGRRATAFRRAA